MRSSTRLLVESVRVVAARDDSRSFDQLIDTVHESDRLGRSVDTENAAATLRRYLGDHDRRLVFLDALASWQNGDRASAVRGFEIVLRTKVKDKAEGIAAHLTATHLHDQERGAEDEAIGFLQRAERALAAVHDHWGMSLTRSTHGRVLRDRATRAVPRDQALLTKSLQQYVAAESALSKLPMDDALDRIRTRARITMGRAETLAEQGELDAALTVARAVFDELPEDAEEKLYCRTLLARLYRDTNQIGEALEALDPDRIRRVGTSRRADAEVARALNVLATVQQRSGDLVGAEQSAADSLALGEELRNRRHVKHATVTLARIKMDRLGPEPSNADIRAVRSLLYRARQDGASISDLLAQLPAERRGPVATQAARVARRSISI
ncbi:hypothetical protein [Curtobacterium flaccumfaciens]|uniref:hypothetical protein n=1 Tax=Curtobacterium flaccumfaciens TaxID=2035 RepID=UPI001BDDFD57|nr:hypothetical protein [Curtobacterium flaccumfaciens]MBT1598464.1 hypothetical protein [Curtobacterium flaccumfaciens pv. flaccumfaciens]